MARSGQDWLSRTIRERVARQWADEAADLARRNRVPSPELRDEAVELHQSLGRFLQLSDARLPRGGGKAVLTDLPPGTDWHWRPLMLRGRIAPAALAGPESGQRLGDEVALFHDCPHRSLILRQSRNRRVTDLSPYGLTLEVMGFAGSYLSLSVDLPDDLRADLGVHHVLRLHAILQSDRPITVYGRLNVGQGPNTETILRQLGHPIDGQNCARTVEFDLGYGGLGARKIDRLWLDLIFEAPYMNAVTLTDAVLSRHPRAQM